MILRLPEKHQIGRVSQDPWRKPMKNPFPKVSMKTTDVIGPSRKTNQFQHIFPSYFQTTRRTAKPSATAAAAINQATSPLPSLAIFFILASSNLCSLVSTSEQITFHLLACFLGCLLSSPIVIFNNDLFICFPLFSSWLLFPKATADLFFCVLGLLQNMLFANLIDSFAP